MKHTIAIFILLSSASAQAFEWSDLWLNDYQKAQKLLQDQPAQAAEKFKDPQWQGVANYNAGNYPEAAQKFSESGAIESAYNQGNALAKAGDLEKSLESYNSLLENPELPKKLQEDATFNRDLVKQLMEQQQEQQQSTENSDDSEQADENQQSEDSDQEGQQSEDQKNAQQNHSDKQEGQSSEEQEKQETNEEQQAQKNDEEKDGKQSEDEINQAQANQDQPMTEDQQATEQWLRQIPDDPSGLLRRKLIQSHRTKYPQIQTGGQAW